MDDAPQPLRPRILIDVDGVINALGPVAKAERTLVEPYWIAVPWGTAERLERLIEPFDPLWATTWEKRAPELISPLIDGIGAEWDHIGFPQFGLDPRVRGTWKLEGILAWAEKPENEHVPLAWVDDDLDEDAFEWAEARTAAGVPTTLVKTDGWLGLTDEDVTRALKFADSLTAK